MKEEGKITKIEDKYAYVLIKRHSACGKCKGCELGTGNRKEIEVKAVNKRGAKLDDKVSVELQAPDILKAAFIVYMVPLLSFALGWFISWTLGITNEMQNLLAGLIFMGIAFLVVKTIDKKMAKTKRYEPIIVEILKDEEQMFD